MDLQREIDKVSVDVAVPSLPSASPPVQLPESIGRSITFWLSRVSECGDCWPVFLRDRKDEVAL